MLVLTVHPLCPVLSALTPMSPSFCPQISHCSGLSSTQSLGGAESKAPPCSFPLAPPPHRPSSPAGHTIPNPVSTPSPPITYPPMMSCSHLAARSLSRTPLPSSSLTSFPHSLYTPSSQHAPRPTKDMGLQTLSNPQQLSKVPELSRYCPQGVRVPSACRLLNCH